VAGVTNVPPSERAATLPAPAAAITAAATLEWLANFAWIAVELASPAARGATTWLCSVAVALAALLVIDWAIFWLAAHPDEVRRLTTAARR